MARCPDALDAVVVDGGHHGLVAATVLADAGWDVCLLEATDRVGGAVRSAQLRAGYVTDLYSAFYPLTAVSPVLRSLFTAFPPVRGPAELLRTLGTAGALWLARFLALPADVPVDAPGQRRLRLATGDAGPRRRFPGAGRWGRRAGGRVGPAGATIPRTPFMLVGQRTTADASRSPSGTESAWAYTHLPRGVSDDESADLLAQRAEEVMERFAPGFSIRVLQRSVQRPGELHRADANLV